VLAGLAACSGDPSAGGKTTAGGASPATTSQGLRYLESTLLSAPLSPADLTDLSIDCPIGSQADSEDYRSAADVDYARAGWERRILADWEFFDVPASEGWITAIDFRREGDHLAYRYLANDNSHDRLYEPWSSSKIQAFTADVAALRQHGIGADASVGGIALAELVTSISSYAPSGKADGNSNAIATFFLNIAGREYATSLFYEEWLNLANEQVRFRGAYGPTAFEPPSYEFVSGDGATRFLPPVYADAGDDPAYLTYRCERCGTDGNKAMTALAQTEWLKRLASHDREPATRHPHLETIDIETLFFGGRGRAGHAVGGMLAGISRILPRALARALAPDSGKDASVILDALTDGRWRVYQKIGWGPSETRGTSELVVLAHVCLPGVAATVREFTVFARASVPGADADESGVGEAGLKLGRVLERALPTLLGGR